MGKKKSEPAVGKRTPGPEKRSRRQTQSQYVYHWDRIIGALVVVSVLAGLATYGIHSLSPSGDLEQIETADMIPTQALKGGKPLATNIDSRIEPAHVAAETAEPQAPAEPVDTPTEPRSGYDEHPAATIEAVVHATDLTVNDEGFKQSTGPERQEVPQSQRRDVDAPEVFEFEDEKAPFSLVDTRLSSPAVKRFGLSKSVVNRKPIGGIDAIRPDSRGVATVYAFSDVVGLRGNSVYYHWMLNGKQVAKVRVGIGADRWRSHSSKVINESMKGAWRVELRDPKGQVLASTDFVY